MEMEITLFASDKDPQGMRTSVSWEKLIEQFRTPRTRDIEKTALRMWSPATFQGDYRAEAQVEKVCAMVFDVDEDVVPTVGDLCDFFKGSRWFAHSSSMSTFLAPRWRLVLSVGLDLTAEEHGMLWHALAQAFPFRVGAASKNASRSWYEPREGTDGSYTLVY